MILRPTILAVLALGCLAGCGRSNPVYINPDPSEMAAAEPVYCYRTLGIPDCYAEPQPGPPNRLIGQAAFVVPR
ncbi:MAG TPA: hypothetical protein VFO41_01515 [Alphaproteobacteria bacterium]|nr:hypothetical protein [Alphaproteobacteria bacterium]